MRYGILRDGQVPHIPREHRQLKSETMCNTCFELAQAILDDLPESVSNLSMPAMVIRLEEGPGVLTIHGLIKVRKLDGKKLGVHAAGCNVSAFLGQGATMRIGVVSNPDGEIELDFMPVVGQVFVASRSG